jgi:hypothetical protein
MSTCMCADCVRDRARAAVLAKYKKASVASVPAPPLPLAPRQIIAPDASKVNLNRLCQSACAESYPTISATILAAYWREGRHTKDEASWFTFVGAVTSAMSRERYRKAADELDTSIVYANTHPELLDEIEQALLQRAPRAREQAVRRPRRA